MKKSIIPIATAVLCGAVLMADDKSPMADELKKLEGNYTVISAEAGGKEFDVKGIGIDLIIIKADRFTVQNQGREVMTFGITIDPTQRPKAMDWINLKEKGAMPLPIIYELDGEKLRVCFPMLPKKGSDSEAAIKPPTRPASFETKDKPIMSLTAKKAKS